MARLTPEIRKQQILDAAMKVAEKQGYQNVRREDIAQKAGVSPASVSLYHGTMAQLRRTIMYHAVSARNLRLIAQGIAARDPAAIRAPIKLKKAAIDLAMKG